MFLSDFDYELPTDLIARYPAPLRRGSRLLSLNGVQGTVRHGSFVDFPSILRAGDLLVLNDTKVIPARFEACRSSGGKVEILLAQILDSHRALALLRASRRSLAGESLLLADDQTVVLRVGVRRGELSELQFPPQLEIEAALERFGNIPLPPYLRRPAEDSDCERYQTVYARTPGAIAAPTAGLHFDEHMLAALRAKGVGVSFLSLHTGLGSFAPIRVNDVREHVMHTEQCEVSPELCREIRAVRASGGRVVAVGTTVVRSLEYAARSGEICAFRGENQLFIYPGFRFRVVDLLLSNFHLPKSSLLLLVAAFAGRENVLAAYREAVQQGYRFYSYGDAMLLTPGPGVRDG